MGRRRRDDWSPYALPGIRRSYAQAASALAVGDPEAEHVFSLQERRAMVAELYWVTVDMARVALDASTDVPDIDLTPVLPVDHGLMAFSQPLPPVPWQTFPGEVTPEQVQEALGDPLSTDALMWSREGDAISVDAFTRTKRPHRQGAPVAGPFVIGAGVDIPGDPVPADQIADPSTRALAAFLQSAFALMAMPTVAQTRDMDTSTGATRPRAVGSPSAPQGPRDVRCVDVRPLRHVTATTDTSSSTGRVYTHRWIVRGHWRQQAVGPKRGERRTTWIPSYSKGPDGAPLMGAEQVMVWRH